MKIHPIIFEDGSLDPSDRTAAYPDGCGEPSSQSLSHYFRNSLIQACDMSYLLAHACHNVVAYVQMTNDMDDRENEPDANERPLFAHPPWMVGIVLVFGMLAIMAGFSDPIWFFVGMPCILVLVLYIYVKIVTKFRREK